MNLYTFSFSVEDNIQAESLEEAWKIARERVVSGFYGPTQANLEFIEELPEEAEEVAAES